MINKETSKKSNTSDILTIISSDDNLSSHKNNDITTSNNKITLEDFLSRTDKVVLNIATYDEFLALAKVMNNLNLKTYSGNDFSNIIDDIWSRFEHITIMTPDRRFAGGVEAAKWRGYQVISFKDIDLSKHLSQDELKQLGLSTTNADIVNKDNKQDDIEIVTPKNIPSEKITLEEFLNSDLDLCIDCDIPYWQEQVLKKCIKRISGKKIDVDYPNKFNLNCRTRKFLKNKSTIPSYYGRGTVETIWDKYIKPIPFEKIDLTYWLNYREYMRMKRKLGYIPTEYEFNIEDLVKPHEKQLFNIGIILDEEWKIDILNSVFERLCFFMYKNGRTYTGDKNGSSDYDIFYKLQNIKHLASVHNNNFVYNPNITEDDYAGFYNYDKIYKFDDIILQPYLSDEEIRMINDMKNNSQVKYTFEELNNELYGRGWFGTYYLCDEPWQMQLLMDLFSKSYRISISRDIDVNRVDCPLKFQNSDDGRYTLITQDKNYTDDSLTSFKFHFSQIDFRNVLNQSQRDEFIEKMGYDPYVFVDFEKSKDNILTK